MPHTEGDYVSAQLIVPIALRNSATFNNMVPVVRQVKKTILSTTGEVVELVIGYKRCDYFSLSFSSTDYPEV